MDSLKNVITSIDYIENHLMEKIDLDLVADTVHYSKYHLHRMFTDLAGLTIHDYIQRRKLTEAAKLLVFSEKSIIEIALLAGYAIQQTFTGIFKAMYKQSPNQFRRNEVFYPLQLEYKFSNHPALNRKRQEVARELRFATEADIALWMDLVRLVIDGFPNLIEAAHLKVLRQRIAERSALIMAEGDLAVGIMMIAYATGSIDFLGVHPLYRKQGGLKANQLIRHLVIDEMQDYTPIQYVVLNKLFNCKKTILGDFGQALNPNHWYSLDDLRRVYGDAEIIELNKSYRSTYEIITFAKRIQKVAALEPVLRHGATPEIIFCRDPQDQLAKISAKIKAFEVSGKTTLGIILKTNSQAKAFYQILAADYDLQLLTPDSERFTKGITITSIQMSKGLEFDEVIIPAANRETFHTDADRKLLYVACTRAMHRLALLYTGELTGLIKTNASI
jgi:AraC-like DNA-binding protein